MRVFIAVIVALAPLLATAQPCRPHVEVHPAGTSAMFRPHTDAFQRCPVDRETYARVLREWLASAPGGVKSVALGRAVHYPWLSELMREWDGGRQPTPAMLNAMAAPFEGSRYEVVGTSFEKVLRGADRLAFDAQVWLRIRPR
jgi:hypothetical protein